MNLVKPTTRALKKINRSNALKKIYFEGPITRLELSKLTGLSPATVTNLVFAAADTNANGLADWWLWIVCPCT